MDNSTSVHFGTAAVFQDLFVSSPDAVIVAAADGRILEANPRVEQLFGYSREELIGQPVESLVPERFRPGHPALRQNYQAAPKVRQMGVGPELYGRRRDGSEFPVEIMLSPVTSSEAGLVLAVVRDITERRRAEEARQQSEQLAHSLVEGVPDYAIFRLDPNGIVASWSSAAERMKGYRAEEVIGRHLSKFYTPEDVARGWPQQELATAAERGRLEDDGWRMRKDGTRFWANVVITALRDTRGQLTGFVKITRDITERKHAQEALVLEITNVLISNLDIRKLLGAISSSIQQVVAHDFTVLALYDVAEGKLRVRFLRAPAEAALEGTEQTLPLEGSLSYRVVATREPLVRNGVPDGLSPESAALWNRTGMKSICLLPLISRERVIGVLNLASRAVGAFDTADTQLLMQVASQVALAIDNAEAFRQLAEVKERLIDEKRYLEEEIKTELNFEDIVGESAALKDVLRQVETVAATDATVLILGETGTGKELVARDVHALSPRRDRTFVKLNCAAIPTGLLESELFGHEKGAFTGAISRKIGRLELAHEGTFFLDEVGDIPPELQPKLLRALQEKEFERLGSTRTIPVNVRLIAATNRDLEAMVKDRSFRSDLYYRLKVFPIRVPPLRARSEDIPLLVHYFTKKFASRMNKRIETIPTEAMDALVRWSWPGNVRELENFLERAVILTRGAALQIPFAELETPLELEPELPESKGDGQSGSLERAEREHILRILRETKGVIAGPNGAAARLGLKRTTLNFKMRKLGITRQDI